MGGFARFFFAYTASPPGILLRRTCNGRCEGVGLVAALHVVAELVPDVDGPTLRVDGLVVWRRPLGPDARLLMRKAAAVDARLELLVVLGQCLEFRLLLGSALAVAVRSRRRKHDTLSDTVIIRFIGQAFNTSLELITSGLVDAILHVNPLSNNSFVDMLHLLQLLL